MYIHNVYLSSYSPSNPLSGHCEVRLDSGQQLRIELTPDECLAIQSTAIASYCRSRQALADEILSSQPTILAIAAPVYEDAEIEECF